MDENYTDVLRTSLLNPSSYLSLPSVKKSPQQVQQKTDGYGLVSSRWIESSTSRSPETPELQIFVHLEEVQVH